MNIYIDESGSITKKYANRYPYFIIALIHVKDKEKLKRVYKRFVSSRMKRLKELDEGEKMFKNGEFRELKGNSFDSAMKKDFVKYFSRNNYFDIYYIKINNANITDTFCQSTGRAFNYVICKALHYFYSHGYLVDEGCHLQLDERNEGKDTKFFLEQYLNTELMGSGIVHNEFDVKYFDSSLNQFIQIADVFANLLFSHLHTGAYSDEIEYLQKNGYLKFIFQFPLK